MARVRLTTSSAVAEDCRALTFTRGVMTCCAVSSASESVRTNRSAVSCSRAPAWAECRARETSSPGVRAEASSSVGSTPRARTSRLATEFSPAITGRNSGAKACCGPATKRATCIGLDTAQFLGTSSPITICTAEASSMPTTTATPDTAPSGMPIAVMGPLQQLGERRFGEHADDERGDGDAELGAGELEGQLLERVDDRTGPSVALGGGLLGVGALDRDEAELGRHEEAVGENQQERRCRGAAGGWSCRRLDMSGGGGAGTTGRSVHRWRESLLG